MIIITLLLISCSLFAAEQHYSATPTCSSSVMPASPVQGNIFAQLDMRPTINIANLCRAYNNGQAETLQRFLPPYRDILNVVTNNEPLDNLHALVNNPTTSDLLYGELPQENRLGISLQHNMHALMACAYLQHNDPQRAYIATRNALAVTTEADLIDQFGCPSHSPITALVAEHLLLRIHPEHREESNLTVLGGHIAAARRYMAHEIQEKGPWTSLDVRIITWFTALCHDRIKECLVTPEEYHQIAQKIKTWGNLEIEKHFLRTQFEASGLTPIHGKAHMFTTARAYCQFLRATNPTDPQDHILQTEAIVADHGDYEAALNVGRTFLVRAMRSEDTPERTMLFHHAKIYLDIACKQQKDIAIANLASLELAKLPNNEPKHKNGSVVVSSIENSYIHIKQIVENYKGVLRRLGKEHKLAARAHAYLVLYYHDLSLLETNETLLKSYKKAIVEHTRAVTNSNDTIANNLLTTKTALLATAKSEKIPTHIVKAVNTMLINSTTDASSSNVADEQFNVDAIIARFDPSICFESHEAAANAWALRARIAKIDKDEKLQRICLLKAHALDALNPLVKDDIQNYFNELFELMTAESLESIEQMLDVMDTQRHTQINDFFRANVEEQRGRLYACSDSMKRALELYQACKSIPQACYNAGAIYHHGNSCIPADLDAARAHYELAHQGDPKNPLYIRTLAHVAKVQGRYDDQFELLSKVMPQEYSNARDAYELGMLWLSGKAKEPDTEGIFGCFALASNLNLMRQTLDDETANMCSALSACLNFQYRPATLGDTKLLLTYASRNIAEAYHALSCQQHYLFEKETNQQKKALYARMERVYLEKALELTPNCNRTKLRLAKLLLPAPSYENIDITTISDAEKTNLDKICTLYEEILASPEHDCFVAEAYIHYGNMLTTVYKKHDRAEELLRKGIALGESGAYLVLLKSYAQQNNYTALNAMITARPTFNFKFRNKVQKEKFETTIHKMNPLRTKALQPA